MPLKYSSALGGLLTVVSLVQPVHAESVFSVSSLALLCGDSSSQSEMACRSYLHGVVEAWMLKDLIGVDPYRYSSHKDGTTFCETISNVSANEWIRIVRSNLASMEQGFAADAVMKVLSKSLCK